MRKEIRIVLIEDDSDDVELLQESLDAHDVFYKMTVLKDGSSAVNFVETTDQLPDIIVMDFNLPRVHGREVIAKIRSTSRFSDVPILILSTSSSKEDIAYAYETGANRYLIKPSTIDSIQETVKAVVELAQTRLSASNAR